MKKKIVSVLLVSAMILTMLAGCSSSSDGDAADTSADSSSVSTSADSDESTTDSTASADYTKAGDVDEVVVGVLSDPENMGPWAGMSQGRIAMLFSVYEYLITREDGVAVGVLAKEWEQVDSYTYNVEIYDYIHDVDNNPLTASDVVFSFESAIATKNYSKLEVIESVTALDDYNIEFVFNKELEIGEFENVMLECAIVTQAAYEASEDEMATTPVGTTAYKVTSYVPGSEYVLEDTGNYWQTDESLVYTTSKHNVGKITFSVITESSQHTVALQTNSVDITNGVPDTDIDKFDEGGEYEEGHGVSIVADNLTYNIEYNMSSDSVFADDLNLRLAIAYAIDCDGLNEGAYNGNGWVVKDFGNSGYPDYISDWDDEEYYDYDPDLAAEYLAQSNYDGQTIRIMYITDVYFDTIAQMIQAYLMQIGIDDVELIPYDQQMFQSEQYDSTSYDILLKTNGSTDYIVNQYKLVWDARDYESMTGGTANYVVDDTLQELMEACLSTETHGEESISAFHDYLYEQCYGYGLIQGTINVVHSNYITSVALDSRNQILPGACEYAE